MNELAKVLKAVADPKRLQMLDLLSCGTMCACDFTEKLEASQPNISHHLKILKEAGLVAANKRGRWVDYNLNQEKIDWLQEKFNQVVADCPQECEITRSNCEDKINFLKEEKYESNNS
jgi:ArsR family transcriptional regulator